MSLLLAFPVRGQWKAFTGPCTLECCSLGSESGEIRALLSFSCSDPSCDGCESHLQANPCGFLLPK